MIKINRGQILLSALLVALNVILFNLVMGQFRSLRVDLTDGKVFSLSPTTERLLGNLVEPVEILAYVSKDENINDQVRPLVPEVMDLLQEYEIKGRGKVRLRRIIPEADEKVEAEARADYRIRPQLGIFRDARQQGVQSFYLSLVVKYPGTDPVTLNADELITQNIFAATKSLELGNVELALTKAIKKAVLGFESKRNLFKKFPSELTVTTVMSPAESFPESLRDVPERIGKLLDDLAGRSGGKLVHVRADLKDTALVDRLRVPALEIEGQTEPVYLAMVVAMEGQSARVPLVDFEGVRSNDWIEELIMGQVKRSSPGLLRKVGVAEHMPDPDGMLEMQGQKTPPPSYVALARALSSDYDVVNLDLGSLEALPADLDLLLVMEPAGLNERAAYVIDQFVMAGGKTIFCLDRSNSSLITRQKEGADARDTGLEAMLADWGIDLGEGVLLDPNCGNMFQDRGRNARPLEGPWASLVEVGIAPDGVNREVGFMKAFEAVRFWFPGYLELRPVDGLSSQWLLRSAENSWVRSAKPSLEPDLGRFPKTAFAGPGEGEKRGRRILAAAIEGVFPSHWAGKDAPKKVKAQDPDSDDAETTALSDHPIASSRPTRVVVVANGEFVDLVQDNLARQVGPSLSLFPSNLAFIQNTIDWLLEDDDLAAIRNRGRSFRPLERLDDEAVNGAILWNFLTPLGVLSALGTALFLVRRTRKPLI